MRLYRNPLAALATALLLGASLTGCGAASFLATGTDGAIAAAGKKTQIQREKVFVTIRGTITLLLPDDTQGNPHQLFRLKAMIKGKETIVQCAHNTKLAPYVPLKVGDAVEIKGEFIDEKPYDIIHWTHYDPKGGEGGYISHQGKKYDKI